MKVGKLAVKPFTFQLLAALVDSFESYKRKSKDITPIESYIRALIDGTKLIAVSDSCTDFVIFHVEQIDDYLSLWIDATYSATTESNAFEHFMEDCREFAQTIPNCKCIRWASRRKAYQYGLKRNKRIGQYEIEQIVFRLDL